MKHLEGFDLRSYWEFWGRSTIRLLSAIGANPASQEDVSFRSDGAVINETRIMAAQWLLILDSSTSASSSAAAAAAAAATTTTTTTATTATATATATATTTPPPPAAAAAASTAATRFTCCSSC